MKWLQYPSQIVLNSKYHCPIIFFICKFYNEHPLRSNNGWNTLFTVWNGLRVDFLCCKDPCEDLQTTRNYTNPLCPSLNIHKLQLGMHLANPFHKPYWQSKYWFTVPKLLNWTNLTDILHNCHWFWNYIGTRPSLKKKGVHGYLAKWTTIWDIPLVQMSHMLTSSIHLMLCVFDLTMRPQLFRIWKPQRTAMHFRDKFVWHINPTLCSVYIVFTNKHPHRVKSKSLYRISRLSLDNMECHITVN